MNNGWGRISVLRLSDQAYYIDEIQYKIGEKLYIENAHQC
jgi:hypothetical protein